MNEKQLLKVTDDLISYLNDKTETLNSYVYRNGETFNFFNDKEKLHMQDVKELFKLARSLSILCIIIIIMLFMLNLNNLRTLSILLYKSMAILTILFLSFAIFISTSFERYFIHFHEIFFNNELWLLDYDVDMLIRILPLSFFIDISAVIFIIFISFMVFITLTFFMTSRFFKEV